MWQHVKTAQYACKLSRGTDTTQPPVGEEFWGLELIPELELPHDQMWRFDIRINSFPDKRFRFGLLFEVVEEEQFRKLRVLYTKMEEATLKEIEIVQLNKQVAKLKEAKGDVKATDDLLQTKKRELQGLTKVAHEELINFLNYLLNTLEEIPKDLLRLKARYEPFKSLLNEPRSKKILNDPFVFLRPEQRKAAMVAAHQFHLEHEKAAAAEFAARQKKQEAEAEDEKAKDKASKDKSSNSGAAASSASAPQRAGSIVQFPTDDYSDQQLKQALRTDSGLFDPSQKSQSSSSSQLSQTPPQTPPAAEEGAGAAEAARPAATPSDKDEKDNKRKKPEKSETDEAANPVIKDEEEAKAGDERPAKRAKPDNPKREPSIGTRFALEQPRRRGRLKSAAEFANSLSSASEAPPLTTPAAAVSSVPPSQPPNAADSVVKRLVH